MASEESARVCGFHGKGSWKRVLMCWQEGTGVVVRRRVRAGWVVVPVVRAEIARKMGSAGIQRLKRSLANPPRHDLMTRCRHEIAEIGPPGSAGKVP